MSAHQKYIIEVDVQRSADGVVSVVYSGGLQALPKDVLLVIQNQVVGCILSEDDEVSKLGQLPLNEHGFPIYPKGTPVTEVREHDRGQKLVFHCKEHPDAVWASKDPLVSNWFGSHFKEVCSHGYELETYVLAEDYSPTRNG